MEKLAGFQNHAEFYLNVQHGTIGRALMWDGRHWHYFGTYYELKPAQ